VLLRVRRRDQDLAFFSMTAVVDAPLDVTVAEVTIESFYPAMPKPLRRYTIGYRSSDATRLSAS
jgi:hypothetical protein